MLAEDLAACLANPFDDVRPVQDADVPFSHSSSGVVRFSLPEIPSVNGFSLGSCWVHRRPFGAVHGGPPDPTQLQRERHEVVGHPISVDAGRASSWGQTWSATGQYEGGRRGSRRPGPCRWLGRTPRRECARVRVSTRQGPWGGRGHGLELEITGLAGNCRASPTTSELEEYPSRHFRQDGQTTRRYV